MKEILKLRYGRTRSEQLKNARAESDEIPRGKGGSAADGRDGIAREQFIAKNLWELGIDKKQVVETHSGRTLTFKPLPRDEQYDRMFPGYKYRPTPIDQSEIRRMVRIALRKE